MELQRHNTVMNVVHNLQRWSMWTAATSQENSFSSTLKEEEGVVGNWFIQYIGIVSILSVRSERHHCLQGQYTGLVCPLHSSRTLSENAAPNALSEGSHRSWIDFQVGVLVWASKQCIGYQARRNKLCWVGAELIKARFQEKPVIWTAFEYSKHLPVWVHIDTLLCWFKICQRQKMLLKQSHLGLSK